jgi:hypothetical protein
MDSVASRCFVSYAFANTFKLKVKKGNNAMVSGNGDQVPMDNHIKVHVRIQEFHSQINCLVSKLNDVNDLILGNDWLVEHKACLNF